MNPAQTFRAFVWTVLGALAVCTIIACSKSGPSTFTPAITSPLSAERVRADAQAWAQADLANRFLANVEDTHSMEPFFTNRSLPLCVRYTGQAVPNGTVAIVARDGLHVIHVVADQTADAVFTSGYNNHASDGWTPKSRIEGIVVGQLYLP